LNERATRGNALGARFSPDGRLFVSIPEQRTTNIYEISILNDAAMKKMTNFPRDLIFDFDFSPDGKKMILIRGTREFDAVMFTEEGQ
jgi:dipeptidyl aminopeptidase/acylaminoacyl peptidase